MFREGGALFWNLRNLLELSTVRWLARTVRERGDVVRVPRYATWRSTLLFSPPAGRFNPDVVLPMIVCVE
nr:hypothetical protein CFP56_02801 [Quercus suber]